MRNYNSNILSTKSSPTTAVIASVIPIVATVVTVGIARALIKSVRDKKQQELQNCEQQQTQQQPYCVTLSLPEWLVDKLPEYKKGAYESDEARMALAIEISRLNVLHRTGGPFGCVIFKNVNGVFELVSAGLNRVVPLKNSTLHGEMVAIQLAQQHVGCYTLNDGNNMCSYELYTSCEPCCMCLGASLWSGVSRIVCGATKMDASEIGFDEGPVYEESYKHLNTAGIDVKRGVLRKKAAEVLQLYSQQGLIYNR